MVGHRAEVPRGAAPLPARRAVVPADRRGRHRARPRRQRSPAARRREGPFEPHPANPVLTRRSTVAADPEHRPRRPGRDPRRRQRAGPARHAPARHDPVVLAARPGDVRRPRSPGSTAGRSPSRCMLAPRAGVDEETFDFADAAALDDPGWLAVRTTPAVGRDRPRRPPGHHRQRSRLDDPHPQFVGRRQRHLTATVSTTVDASAGAGGLAAALRRGAAAFALEATRATSSRPARASPGSRRRGRPRSRRGEVELRIEMAPRRGRLHPAAMGGDRVRLLAGRHAAHRARRPLLDRGDLRRPSPAGCSGSTPPTGTVRFADFRYRGSED